MMARMALVMLAALSIVPIRETALAADFAKPNFRDYPASETTIGSISKPRLETAKDRQYRSAILEAAHKGKVNFAGHYIFSVVDCGSSCSMAFILDAKSGSIYWLPFKVSYTARNDNGIGHEFYAFDFRTYSKLLVVQGSRDERDDDGLYDYVFSDGHLRLVKSQRYPP